MNPKLLNIEIPICEALPDKSFWYIWSDRVEFYNKWGVQKYLKTLSYRSIGVRGEAPARSIKGPVGPVGVQMRT